MATSVGKSLLWVGIFATLLIMAIAAVVMSANPPEGYTVRIDHAGKSYYAKDWRFDESHNCVVFADQYQTHRVLCGDYSMENVK